MVRPNKWGKEITQEMKLFIISLQWNNNHLQSLFKCIVSGPKWGYKQFKYTLSGLRQFSQAMSNKDTQTCHFRLKSKVSVS